jgi:predicted aspartyl protease
MKLTRWLTVLMCLPLLAVRGHDVLFKSGQSAVCIPFDAGNRHVGLTAKINDQDGMRLVIDTGAGGSVLDEKRAASLGLATFGTQQARGSGGLAEGSTVRGVNVTLPGFQLLDQTMGTLALGAIAAQAGRPLDGILGHPLLSRCVVEIDYARQCVSLFDPDTYKYSGTGRVRADHVQGKPSYVKASVVLPDGRSISGKFVIDTGASTGLALSADPVQREGVLASLGKTMVVRSLGVGGATEIRLARVARLELGGFSLEQPVTAFHPEGIGRISAEGTLGNIGGGILSRFKVIFDYSRRRMILEPGPDVARPFEADMSGLGLVTAPPDFRRVTVARVVDPSPALESGFQAGDEIESVDGTPAGEIGLSELREKLKLDGVELRLAVRRGTERIELPLKTRRMI